MTAKLRPDEIQGFKDDGYVIYDRQVLQPEQMGRLEGIFREHHAAKGEKLSDELDTPHFEDARLLDFLLSPEVLDVAECLLGPDLALWSSHFICKDPHVGRATPWHEDSAYWAGRMNRFDKIVTVWLALDDVDRANGCMEVVAGSHLGGGFSQYEAVNTAGNTFGLAIPQVDESRVVPFELKRGECSLHDGRIVHGAGPNNSNRRRLGYTMRYISADVRVVPERNVGHRLWLARGRPLAANEYVNC